MTSESNTTKVSDDGRKVTFGYSRKVSPKQYESEEVSIFITDEVPADTESVLMWAANVAPAAMTVIKAQVWDALGLPFSFDEEGVPHLDKPAPPRPVDNRGPSGQPPPQHPATPPQQAPGAPVPGSRPADGPAMAQVGYYADFPGFCKDCGQQGTDAFYDNRTEQDQKIQAGQKIGPDFKCRHCGGGNGKGKPLFRPGSYDYNQAVGSGQAGAPAMTPPPSPY